MNFTANSRLKILIVEDFLPLLKSLSLTLQSNNYEVHQASTYKEAVQMLEQESFNLVLSDINLGENSGIELISVITSDELKDKHEKAPALLFMTGNTVNLLEPELENYTVFHKPFSIQELLKVIAKQLNLEQVS